MFSVYYVPNFTTQDKVHLDGTKETPRHKYHAVDLARENASAMPEQYIFVENFHTGMIVYRVINRNGHLIESYH